MGCSASRTMPRGLKMLALFCCGEDSRYTLICENL
jgi:hypothetical protein